MRDFLKDLGLNYSIKNIFFVVSWVILLVLVSLSLTLLFPYFDNSLKLIIQLFIWVFWFYWQSELFVRHHNFKNSILILSKYRKIIIFEVLPFASLCLAQFIRPLTFSLLIKNPFAFNFQLFVSIILFVFGIYLIYSAFSTISLSSAFFKNEFIPKNDGEVYKIQGIYKWIRHPLIGGAMIICIGSTFLFELRIDTIALCLCNLLMAPIYGIIEDNRQTRLFGSKYKEYKEKVGGFIPNF